MCTQPSSLSFCLSLTRSLARSCTTTTGTRMLVYGDSTVSTCPKAVVTSVLVLLSGTLDHWRPIKTARRRAHSPAPTNQSDSGLIRCEMNLTFCNAALQADIKAFLIFCPSVLGLPQDSFYDTCTIVAIVLANITNATVHTFTPCVCCMLYACVARESMLLLFFVCLVLV